MPRPIAAPALIAGPYRAPRGRAYAVGRVAGCKIRGDVAITAISDAPIPWPVGRPAPRGLALPIVTDELARAIATESVQAVAYHWGISRWTVGRWRRALNVPRFNAGTSARWSELTAVRLSAEARAKGGRRSRKGRRD